MKRLVEKCRGDLAFADYNDISKNLPEFMEYVNEHKRHPRMSWAEFEDRWADCSKCVHVKYEDLRMRPVEELQRIVKQLSGQELVVNYVTEVVEKYSFERVSGRKVREEKYTIFYA